MPIPDFDHNSVLPPHTGDVTRAENMSPYRVGSLEVVQRFATSAARVDVLGGWLRLRNDLRQIHLAGFQWLDGSFLEDVEHLRGRPPADIDVVTFYQRSAGPLDPEVMTRIRDHATTKAAYRVDHYLVPLSGPPERLVEQSRFWFGLFSHQKSTAIWKGMLHVDLNDVAGDNAACQHLATLVFP